MGDDGAMVSMPTRRREADVVFGPCPGCDSWQLDYTYDVAQEFIALRPVPRESELEQPYEVDLQPFHDAVEEILQEHYDECPHLRDLVAPHL